MAETLDLAVSEYTCIVCPLSCRLRVEEKDGQLLISGNTCKRGLDFGRAEHTAPTRMLTSTVRIDGALFPRLPVMGTAEVPKARLRECLAEVYRTQVSAPVRCGEVVVANVCGTGVDIVASRTMDAV